MCQQNKLVDSQNEQEKDLLFDNDDSSLSNSSSS